MTVTRVNPHKINLEHNLFPQEEMLEQAEYSRKLTIGIPKAGNQFESRIILSPGAVKQLVAEGHTVLIEKEAGLKSNWSDTDYQNAGAVFATRKEIFNSEIITKVSPFDAKDIEDLAYNRMIISSLHAGTQTRKNIASLIKKRTTAVALEFVKDENSFYPFVNSMSEIAGILAVMTAGKYLSNYLGGKGIILGGITGVKPTSVVILGAGIAGVSAAKAALGLGAQVFIFDNSIAKLQKVKNCTNNSVITGIFQKSILEERVKEADLIIGAVDFTGEIPPFVITENMVRDMKKGSVIVDLNTDNFSYFATSKVTDFGSPVYEKHGVLHYCVPNIASEASRTASVSLSNSLLPLLIKLGHSGNAMNAIKSSACLRNGTYIYEGILTSELLGRKFSLDYKRIELLTTLF